MLIFPSSADVVEAIAVRIASHKISPKTVIGSLATTRVPLRTRLSKSSRQLKQTIGPILHYRRPGQSHVR